MPSTSTAVSITRHRSEITSITISLGAAWVVRFPHLASAKATLQHSTYLRTRHFSFSLMKVCAVQQMILSTRGLRHPSFEILFNKSDLVPSLLASWGPPA